MKSVMKEKIELILEKDMTLSDLLEILPGGLSIALDPFCDTIVHNSVASNFWRLEEGKNFSYSSFTLPDVMICKDGKELSAEEIPLQQAVKYSKKNVTNTMEMIWKDGIKKTAISSASPLFDNDGQVIGGICTFQDISQQIYLEQELKKHRDLLEELVSKRSIELQNANAALAREMVKLKKSSDDYYQILDRTTDGFIALDKKCKLTFISKSAKEIVNIQEDQNITGTNLWTFFEDDYLKGQLMDSVKNQELSYFEYFSKLTEKYYKVSAYPSSDGLTVYFHDITTEREESYTKELLSSIVNSASEGIFSVDLEKKIQTWNKGAELITGYSAEEVLNTQVDSDPLLYSDHVLEALLNSFQGKSIRNMEVTKRKKDGSTVYLSQTVSPIIDNNGKVKGASVIFSDVTERKTAELKMARLENLHVIGEMAASISHEVRNPMTTIRGFIQLLSAKPECEKYKDILDIMIQELDRANSIITEFLSIGGKKQVKMTVQNLNNIVNTLLPLLEAEALEKDKQIFAELADIPDLPLNTNEIRQLILNLSKNGLEAMRSGQSLLIKTYSENDQVVLAVQDQGPGISEEVLANLGKAFFTTKSSGTGLGLTTCYSIAEKHKAKINVCTSNFGTTFLVNFPLVNVV